MSVYRLRLILLCILALGTTASDVQAKSSDEACMLQVPQAMQLQPRADDNSHAVRSNMTEEEWFKREYHLMAHVKGGFELSKASAKAMEDSIRGPNGEKPTIICWGQNLSHASSADNVMWDKVNEPACFEHMVRNPFEMLVSGYLYNAAGSEPWMKMTFQQAKDGMPGWHGDNANCDPILVDCGISASKACQEEWKNAQYESIHGLLRSVTQLYDCSRSGPMSSLLPDAKLDETFQEYMQRVSVEEALTAQYIYASDSTLYPMFFQHDYFKERDCATELCFSSLYTDCREQWSEVLKVWEVPDAYFNDMLEAAVSQCPGNSMQAVKHSSSHRAEQDGVQHRPENSMVLQLRHIDQQHLNGEISGLETKFECQPGEKYSVSDTMLGQTTTINK